jgi:hypothetical protein
MIKFRSFLEGLRYRSKCPLCSKQMEVNDRDLVERLEYPLGHPYQRFTFYLGQRSDDVLLVDPNSEMVVIKYATVQETTNGMYTGRVAGNYTIYNGEWRHALTMNCNSCSQYHFTLQVHSNLTERRLIGTFLNSESVSVEENDMVHEVRNVYSMEKTEYTCFPKDGSSKRSSIPLVPLNLSDPKETISRIRKLLIFS